MAAQQRWLWPLFPAVNSQPLRNWRGTRACEDGQTISLPLVRCDDGNVVVTSGATGLRPQTGECRDYYAPTASDIAMVAALYPDICKYNVAEDELGGWYAVTAYEFDFRWARDRSNAPWNLIVEELRRCDCSDESMAEMNAVELLQELTQELTQKAEAASLRCQDCDQQRPIGRRLYARCQSCEDSRQRDKRQWESRSMVSVVVSVIRQRMQAESENDEVKINSLKAMEAEFADTLSDVKVQLRRLGRLGLNEDLTVDFLETKLPEIVREASISQGSSHSKELTISAARELRLADVWVLLAAQAAPRQSGAATKPPVASPETTDPRVDTEAEMSGDTPTNPALPNRPKSKAFEAFAKSLMGDSQEAIALQVYGDRKKQYQVSRDLKAVEKYLGLCGIPKDKWKSESEKPDFVTWDSEMIEAGKRLDGRSSRQRSKSEDSYG